MAGSPVILTLDAGGTNFVFSAVKDKKIIVDPVTKPSHAHDSDQCIQQIISGFKEVSAQIDGPVEGISFAFPGPADYALGILGDLPNFPAFNGDVPLGPILEEAFGIPVFINNDGDLFALGEAISGYLPYLNDELKKRGSRKQFKNLIGITLGTGVGAGIVINGKLLEGDNTCSAEIHNTLNHLHPEWNCEENVSTRAIQRVYATEANQGFDPTLLPLHIYEMALGKREGNQNAAKASFEAFGRALGNTICNLVTLIDGIVVLGGGITAGWDLYGPFVLEEINRPYVDHLGGKHARLSFKVYDLTRKNNFESFAKGAVKELSVPGSNRVITYDNIPRTGIGISQLGASKAIMLGAYDYALERLG
jgi:glucokinase